MYILTQTILKWIEILTLKKKTMAQSRHGSNRKWNPPAGHGKNKELEEELMKDLLEHKDSVGHGTFKAIQNGKGQERRKQLLYTKVSKRPAESAIDRFSHSAFNRQELMRRINKQLKPETDALQEPLSDYERKAEGALRMTANQVGLEEVANQNFYRKRNLFTMSQGVNY